MVNNEVSWQIAQVQRLQRFLQTKKIARKHSQNSHKDRPKFVRRQFKTKRLVSKNFKDSINALKSSEFM